MDSRVVLMVDVGSVKAKFDFRHLGRGVCVCVCVCMCDFPTVHVISKNYRHSEYC